MSEILVIRQSDNMWANDGLKSLRKQRNDSGTYVTSEAHQQVTGDSCCFWLIMPPQDKLAAPCCEQLYGLI